MPNKKLKKIDFTKEIHDIYSILIEKNKKSTKECFYKIRILGKIPTADHQYHGKNLIITYISGDRQLFEARRSFISERIFNGYCTALKEFFYEDLYEFSNGFPKDIMKSWNHSSSTIYTANFREEYFRGLDKKSYDAKHSHVKDLLEDYIAQCELEEELRTLENR